MTLALALPADLAARVEQLARERGISEQEVVYALLVFAFEHTNLAEALDEPPLGDA